MSAICERLHHKAWELPRFTFPFKEKELPANGIYILFEQGEQGHGGERIVRIGTHTGMNNLVSRLKEHFLHENKDRSIFRKNIGRSILKQIGDPYLEIWELDFTSNAAKAKANLINYQHQQSIEALITKRLHETFSFSVIPIENKELRIEFESKLISTVSMCEECGPSSAWLGSYSPKQKIRDSGLWLVNGLCGPPLRQEELGTLL